MKRRALVITLAVVFLLAGGGLGAAWAYGRSLDHHLARTNAFAGLPSERPTETVTGALNILVLGSDSRDPDSTTDSRTDTIMLVHVDADHQHAYSISIPRDTWVYVPESADGRNGGTKAKINAAYAWGGTPLVVQTVERYTGVRIDHVVLVDFAGFARITDALGGVDMYVDQSITSIHPPYRKFTKGEHHFTGAEALDYVRQRYQFKDGDFTREKHQQAFLKALMDKAASTGTLTDPVRLNAFLQAVTRSVTVDEDFDLVDTALALRDLRANDITFLTSPSTGTATVDGQSVVEPDTVKAKALYAAVRDDTVAQWVAAQASR
uniref:LCP family protein n=1 Tax=Phytohabitans aurantiacus TaxID=3016789 RepID=UPI002490EFC7|nr:LCP family protein [Phytohabitans aurantiacus]